MERGQNLQSKEKHKKSKKTIFEIKINIFIFSDEYAIQVICPVSRYSSISIDILTHLNLETQEDLGDIFTGGGFVGSATFWPPGSGSKG